MSPNLSVPLACPSGQRSTEHALRVSVTDRRRKAVTIRCASCGFERRVEVEEAALPHATKADGPRLDSSFRVVDGLFSQIRTCWRLVGSAQKFPPGGHYTRTVAAAKQSLANVMRLAPRTALTEEEHARLEREVLVLQAAIESCEPRK